MVVGTLTDDLTIRQLHMGKDFAISIEDAARNLEIRRGDCFESQCWPREILVRDKAIVKI